MEIFHEFMYYLFDSILIPLLRANFHVTESNIHRYRLFFFRHDIWRSLAEPAIASLKVNMFEEIKSGDAQNILDSRSLGFSQVRLLPKETGVRPIMNLRRRALKKGSKVQLGTSINTILTPIYNVLSFEKVSHHSTLVVFPNILDLKPRPSRLSPFLHRRLIQTIKILQINPPQSI